MVTLSLTFRQRVHHGENHFLTFLKNRPNNDNNNTEAQWNAQKVR